MSRERTLRTGVILLALPPLAAGVIALISPETFFEQIGTYGARNDHYTGDAGAYLTAYGVALLIAAARPSWRVPLLMLGAGWYGLHALNHLLDIDEAKSDARGIADTVLIALGAVLHLYLARLAGARR
jgi:hypothetical protein